MRRGGFGVVGVGWRAGAFVVAGVVVASPSACLDRGGCSGDEESCDCERPHGGWSERVYLLGCCIDFEKVTGGVGRYCVRE